MSTGYRARIIDQFRFAANEVTLLLRDDDRHAYLMADGTWKVIEEGQVIDGGITLPAEAVEAIAVAIQNWQGHASHADTEARVLREWLAYERGRVDLLVRERMP